MHAAATGRVSKGGPEGPEGPEGSLPNMLSRRPDGAALGGHGPARPAHACTCIRRLLPHRDHGDDPCEAHCPAKVTSARALAFPVPNRFQPAFSLNHPVNKYRQPRRSGQRGRVRPFSCSASGDLVCAATSMGSARAQSPNVTMRRTEFLPDLWVPRSRRREVGGAPGVTLPATGAGV